MKTPPSLCLKFIPMALIRCAPNPERRFANLKGKLELEFDIDVAKIIELLLLLATAATMFRF